MNPHTLSHLSDASDIELITAVSQDRSQKALENLYHRHRHLLRSVIRRILITDADCDDALQDVLLQVWEKAASFSPEKGNILGWLSTMARRRALDRVRKMCAYRNATDRYERTMETADAYASDLYTVEPEVCRNENREQILTHLEKLPEAQLQVVNLTYFQGLSQREIAARLSIPLGTIKTRIELGMQKLGRSLAAARPRKARQPTGPAASETCASVGARSARTRDPQPPERPGPHRAHGVRQTACRRLFAVHPLGPCPP
jgi:RNA polymerase sigma-70 factor (ECF subfamily)